MKLLKIIITVGALVLLAFVGIGLALPGTWEARRSTVVAADPETVFDYLDSVEGWAAWTPFAAVEGRRSGPARGAGATLSWDDPQWGEGEWVLTEARRPRSVSYEVRVEDGSLTTRGRVDLTEADGGTRVEWQEAGDFGWNPLLAYMALGMDRMQGREMEKSLDSLQLRVTGPGAPGPEGRPGG